MSDTVTVPLNAVIETSRKLVLLHIEWWNDLSRFVVVKYTVDDQQLEFGLRIDLDKRVFLDHIDDSSLDDLVQVLAPALCDHVARFRSGHAMRTHLPEKLFSRAM